MKSFFIAILIFLSACREAEYSFEMTRIIENKTDHNIRIIAYTRESVSQTIAIAPFESDSASDVCTKTIGTLAFCDLIFSLDHDSVTVLFDEARYITYCSQQFGCTINEKNIMRLNPFGNFEEEPWNQNGYEEVSKYVFLFPITEEDYNLSEPRGE